jgi:3-hydroxybutyryl-CoA dehydratase
MLAIAKTKLEAIMPDFHVAIGDVNTFSKTVGETDVYLFAGITGDFSPNHTNQVYMERSSFGRRQAHGALLVGFISTVSTLAIAHCRDDLTETPVAVGFDRVRFLKPVYLGDTITVTYTIAAIDMTKRRSTANVEIHNQNGDLVTVAQHLLQWVSNS